MKNILLLIASLFSLSLFSQQCSNDSLLTYPSGDVAYADQGFQDPNILPCIQSAVYSELVIPFKTYNQGARLLTLLDSTTVPVTHIYGIKVENISNLPTGLCWITRPSTSAISGDQVGAIIIKGTTSVTTGVYPLTVTLSLDLQGSGSYTYTGLGPNNYKAILGSAVVKVADSNGTCPSVN